MNIKEYTIKGNYKSRKKALKSVEFVDNVKKCPRCKYCVIPDNSPFYYIPDKRILKNSDYKFYYYVLDAIINGQRILCDLTGITDAVLKFILKELVKEGFIGLKEFQCSNELELSDYYLTKKGIDWKNSEIEQRKKLLYNAVEIIKNSTQILSVFVNL